MIPNLDTLDAVAIIGKMNDDGWLYSIANHAILKPYLVPTTGIVVAAFSKRGIVVSESDCGVSGDFTKAVREGARKALERASND